MTKVLDAYYQIARADGYNERIRKLREEFEELFQAAIQYEGSLREKDRKHVVEELADVAVCVEILIEALDEREAFENIKRFKTYRELCRRWMGDAKWCASNPVKEEPEDDE